MKPVHIARDGRALGRYSPEDVAEGLADGRFQPTDLAWHEDLSDWTRLSALEGLPGVTVRPPAMPDPAAEGSASLSAEEVTGEINVEPAWERSLSPWALSIWATFTAVLSRPREVFSALPAAPGPRRAFLYGLIAGTLGGWFSLSYQTVIGMMDPSLLGEPFEQLKSSDLILISVLSFAIMPVAAAASLYILSGLFHLALGVFSSSAPVFAVTFRVTCYAWGTSSLLQIVPFCGNYLYPAIGIYLTVIGLTQAGSVSVKSAFAATLLPFLLLCGAALLVLTWAMGQPLGTP